MQMDRKIIAVIADSFSPKTEWPWGIESERKYPMKTAFSSRPHLACRICLWPRSFTLSVP